MSNYLGAQVVEVSMAAKTPCVIAHMTVVPENYSPEDHEADESAATDRESDADERRRVTLDA